MHVHQYMYLHIFLRREGGCGATVHTAVLQSMLVLKLCHSARVHTCRTLAIWDRFMFLLSLSTLVQHQIRMENQHVAAVVVSIIHRGASP